MTTGQFTKWNRSAGARTYGWIPRDRLRAAFIYDLVVVDNSNANILNINGADDVLHIVSAIGGLAIALCPARKLVQGDAGRTRAL